MSSPYSLERRIAIEAVYQASHLASSLQGRLKSLDIVGKSDLSPVTLADFSIQALINLHLLSAFPQDKIMGEEDADDLRNPKNSALAENICKEVRIFHPELTNGMILDAIDAGNFAGGSRERFWVLDPIDGTKGFIRGEGYAVALALIVNGEVVLGILGCPKLSETGGMLIAVKGGGCFFLGFEEDAEEVPLHVAENTLPEGVVYCDPEASSLAKGYAVAQAMGAKAEPLTLDNLCQYALVAMGETSIYLRFPSSEHHHEKLWDHAPGVVIVEESGGRVTDLYGKPLDFSLGNSLETNQGLLVTNGLLHEKVLRALAGVLA